MAAVSLSASSASSVNIKNGKVAKYLNRVRTHLGKKGITARHPYWAIDSKKAKKQCVLIGDG